MKSTAKRIVFILMILMLTATLVVGCFTAYSALDYILPLLSM